MEKKKNEGVDPLIWAWHMQHGWNSTHAKSVPSCYILSDLNVFMSLTLLPGRKILFSSFSSKHSKIIPRIDTNFFFKSPLWPVCCLFFSFIWAVFLAKFRKAPFSLGHLLLWHGKSHLFSASGTSTAAFLIPFFFFYSMLATHITEIINYGGQW